MINSPAVGPSVFIDPLPADTEPMSGAALPSNHLPRETPPKTRPPEYGDEAGLDPIADLSAATWRAGTSAPAKTNPITATVLKRPPVPELG